MNDHKETSKRFSLRLSTTFSNLKDDPWLARKVLANAKEGVKVKKNIGWFYTGDCSAAGDCNRVSVCNIT